jgi:hypothetical protein
MTEDELGELDEALCRLLVKVASDPVLVEVVRIMQVVASQLEVGVTTHSLVSRIHDGLFVDQHDKPSVMTRIDRAERWIAARSRIESMLLGALITGLLGAFGVWLFKVL